MSVSARQLASPRPLPPGARVSLAWEILAAYAAMRRSLQDDDFRNTLERLPDTAAAAGRVDELAAARRVARASIRTLSLLPGGSRCLMRSLVVTTLLARRGISARLVVGVRSDDEFEAHAWVEHRGVPVLEPGTFERLLEH